jgi:hypothetical protein
LQNSAPGSLTFEDIENEYCSAFGNAAADIKRYFDRTAAISQMAAEQALAAGEEGGNWTGYYLIGHKLFTPAVFAELTAILKDAEKNAAGDTTAADALSDELLVLMAKRDLLTSGKSNYEAEIVMLENELARIVSALGAPSEYITTPQSGYFYSETDGYEAILTAERAKNMTLKEFDAIISEPPIYTTNAVGTLVTSAKWYFATKTTEENAEGFITGVIYNCLFIDNGYQETIPLKLVSKETENGDALLIFHSSSLPRDFDITRCQRMEAIKSEYTGLRIPTEVVRVKDGVTYVYILKEGVAREREINILWEQNGYFIISETFEGLSERGNLSLNDLIILDESDLYDGKFIH